MRQVLFIISLCLCFPLFAQTSSSQSETDFLNIKKKYLAEQAGLTSKEADAFFPLYFEYQKLKKENNAKVWDNAKEIIKWVAEKGIDVAKIVIPLLLKTAE